MTEQLRRDLSRAIQKLGFKNTEVELSLPAETHFGDYSTNVALQLYKQENKGRFQSAREIANDLVGLVAKLPDTSELIERIEVAGPGFINIFLKDSVLAQELREKLVLPQTDPPKKYLVEYAGPNLSKEFHIGHLRNLIFGEALSRLLEDTGNKVFRATYSSDIGLPLAKTLWGVEHLSDQFEQVKKKSLIEKLQFLGQAYIEGTNAYEEVPDKKAEIDTINKKIYQRDPQYLPLWQMVKDWSLEYLEGLYSRMGAHFDGSFLESEVEESGKRIVEENLGKVFVKDQGAVIFPGEKYGLHNRVFISSQGNPTYEAKEVGLAFAEEKAFLFDKALHIVGSEQSGYFEVVIKAIEIVDPRFKGRKQHISYGLVSLTTGKISSRKGNIVTAEQLLELIKTKVKKLTTAKGENSDKIVEQVTVGAVKFYMLKYAPATDISFDIDKSVSLEGDSGPYLQYTYARTQSVLKNSDEQFKINEITELEPEEHNVLRLLLYFSAAVEESTKFLNPTPLCTYLLNLAKAFNLFYQKHQIIRSSRPGFRLLLTKQVGEALARGLYLLGIEAPERM